MQVRQNTEMESHEEKLHKMIIQVGGCWLAGSGGCGLAICGLRVVPAFCILLAQLLCLLAQLLCLLAQLPCLLTQVLCPPCPVTMLRANSRRFEDLVK